MTNSETIRPMLSASRRLDVSPFQFVGSPASEQSAHYAANQSTWTAIAAVMVSTTPTVTTGRTSFIGSVTAAGAGVRR